MRKIFYAFLILGMMGLFACQNNTDTDNKEVKTDSIATTNMENNIAKYAEVKLTADISTLSENQKQLLAILFDVADIMNTLYWKESYGNKNELLNSITDEKTKRFVEINYGPWDRLSNNEPFVEGMTAKPAGANFYPADMTVEEFEAFDSDDKKGLYTLIKRDDNGNLISIPYHKAFETEIQKASELLLKASELAEDDGFKKYLKLRSEALLTDEYKDSDIAWLEMKDNKIDFVVGPIENYEDALFNAKAAHEAFILIKDMEWSKKLDHYTSMLPDFQKNLPVDEKYKAETPGSSGNQLNAYDVVYYAGDCNAGSKTIAINLPNDPEVREKVGSRKLQLKNAMKAKFDKILIPIANVLIDETQRKHVTFDAFFTNTMFHEVGHGLGLSYLVEDKNNTVQAALKKYYTSIEEGKADILGLWIVTELQKSGEITEEELKNNYVTFMASIFRSIRFGAASSHGKANMVRFNFFKEKEAFTKDIETGTYKVNFDKMKQAMIELAQIILQIQGDGNLEQAKKMIEEKGIIDNDLQNDLNKVEDQGIPVDIVFIQGKKELGL